MRSGRGAAAWEIGGAWQCAVTMPAVDSKPWEPSNPDSTATKIGERDRPCTEAGCTKGACMDGIVLQHSWLCSWPCDEHGIVSQHCIALSGVDMAKQSSAYAARPTASSTITVLFTKRIYNQLRFVLKRSQATPLDDSPKTVGQQIGEPHEGLPMRGGAG
jgi:hypothetical protein